MKATKKIVGAACALVAAVALSAGSTFAWFSSSGTVKATGMQVQANVASNLNIASGLTNIADSFTSTNLDVAQGTATLLNPVYIDSTTEQTLTAKVPNKWTTSPDEDNAGEAQDYQDALVSGNTITHEQTSGVAGYIMNVSMSVMRKAAESNETTSTLSATVTVNWADPSAQNASYKFLKVGFQIWFNSDEGEATYAWVPATQDMTTSGGGDVSTGNWTFELGTLNDNQSAEINFVVWYDGTDPDCYTNNARLTSAMQIEISYTTK